VQNERYLLSFDYIQAYRESDISAEAQSGNEEQTPQGAFATHKTEVNRNVHI